MFFEYITVNQDDLSAERVKNWVKQLRSEGILGSGSSRGQVKDEVTTVNGSSPDMFDELKRENAELKRMLEENSKLMNSVMKGNEPGSGFMPHFNPKTKVTMWTSRDGKTCYYTSGAPQTP